MKNKKKVNKLELIKIKNSCRTKKGCSVEEVILPYLIKELKIAA